MQNYILGLKALWKKLAIIYNLKKDTEFLIEFKLSV